MSTAEKSLVILIGSRSKNTVIYWKIFDVSLSSSCDHNARNSKLSFIFTGSINIVMTTINLTIIWLFYWSGEVSVVQLFNVVTGTHLHTRDRLINTALYFFTVAYTWQTDTPIAWGKSMTNRVCACITFRLATRHAAGVQHYSCGCRCFECRCLQESNEACIHRLKTGWVCVHNDERYDDNPTPLGDGLPHRLTRAFQCAPAAR